MELVIEKKLTVTVIISVYNNVKALNIILQSLLTQSILPDEIIISEDGNSKQMKDFVEKLDILNIKIFHLSCNDVGWRKNIALNKAIVQSSSEYLVFIDGDVIPHHKFIEGHLFCSEINKVCVGKRSELGKKYSNMVYDNLMSVKNISENYIKWIYPLHKDKVHHYEDGIYSHWLNKVTKNRYIRHIIGCNFSCFKKDIMLINGFNEDFKEPSEGEDVDITWRFRGLGIEMKSCRYIANVYHLWHKKGFGDKEGAINRTLMYENMKNEQFICLNGIKKLKEGDKI